MSRIQGRNTKPELLLRRCLYEMGIRYRLKSNLPGKPDLVFHGARVAVFVDGCQWHCCPQHWVRPKSNVEFWDRKFENNRKRDHTVNMLLNHLGWTVLRFWEHDIESDVQNAAKRVATALIEQTSSTLDHRQ